MIPSHRILDLDSGRLMVVTDLHGDYAVYCRYRDHFLTLRADDRADSLLFCGDLIHSDGPADKDGSLRIMLDVLRLKDELKDNLIVLLGNHEMPHIYCVTLAKGRTVYTPRFEAAMGEHRADLLAFFDRLPFYVRTCAGVAIAHAGASRAAADPERFDVLASYSHTAELAKVDEHLNAQDRATLRARLAKLNRQTYAALVVEYLGPAALAENRYDDFLRGAYVSSISEPFQALWDATMNKNERQYSLEIYTNYLEQLLLNLSQDYVPQHLLVSGHISVRGGHQIVAERQLRLASWHHAHPPEAGQYLLLDAGQPINSMAALEAGLGSIFKS